MRKFLAADLFCGAGGTSTGLRQACDEMGLQLKLVAVNHWPTAIDTHSLNHPNVQHVCAAVESIEPRAVVPGGKLDLLVASPECTHHSSARGGKPVSDQKRASAYLVLRWAESLRIDMILLENVPEFRSWGPLGANGQPLKSKKGTLYQHFLAGLRALGYTVEDRILNAADYGAATTRKRLFVMARLGRRPIAWPTPTHSQRGGRTLFGRTAKWRPARDIIDWSLPGQSIFTRKHPLKPATMRRILAGLEKFGGPELKPFLVTLRNHMAGRSVDEPIPTVSAGGQHVGLCEPFLLHMTHATDKGRVHDVDAPLPTITTANRGELALCQPFVLGQQSGSVPRGVDQPIPTVAAAGAISLVEPFLVDVCHGQGDGTRRQHSVDDPLKTQTATNRTALVQPFIVSYHGDHADRGPEPRVHSVEEPLPTATTENRYGIAQPYIVPFFGERDGQKPRTHSVDEPLPAVTSHGAGALIEPFIVPPRHMNAGTVDSIEQPLRTVTAVSGHVFGLVEPFLVKYNGTATARSVDEPIDTVPTHDRFGLVTGDQADGYVLDIRFRMLQPHELGAAMSFPKDYVFTGTKGDAVRQIGNAVDVRQAHALCRALLEDSAAVRAPRRRTKTKVVA